MENRWIMLCGNDRCEFEISHWLYSASELAAMLDQTGFGKVEIYGELDKAAYNR